MKSENPEKKKVQVKLDFTVDAFEELKKLQDTTGFTNNGELIRHALRLLQWSCEEVMKKEGKLFLQKKGEKGIAEVQFPFWIYSGLKQIGNVSRF